MHCIVNPASRDHTSGKRWKQLRPILESKGASISEHLTQAPGHGAKIAWELRDGFDADLIVAVGGDGTVHEVASAIRGSGITLGIIPFGSGNDCARTHEIPLKELEGMAEVLINGKDRSCAAWRLEGFAAESEKSYPAPTNNPWDGEPEREGRVVRWVFLESDAGITSAVSRAKLRRGKWIRGTLKYTYLGLTTIPFWPRRKVELTIDDKPAEIVDISVIAATVGETFGGGYRVCPGVTPHDEDGSIVLAGRLSRLRMLRLMGPMHKGKHIGIWGIKQLKANRIEIKPVDKKGVVHDKPNGKPTWVQADGEPIITAPATLEWHRNQIIIRGAKSVAWDSE